MIEPSVHTIYPIHQDQNFSEDEALDLVDLFLTVTAKSKNKINGLNSKFEYFKNQPEMADQIQLQLNTEIQKWTDKIRRLGGIPLELYQVKVLAEQGHYLWEFPQASLEFYPNLPH